MRKPIKPTDDFWEQMLYELDNTTNEEWMQSEKPVKQTPSTITMLQTPVGYVKIGDIVCYNRCTKQVRIGKVCGFTQTKQLVIKQGLNIEFGQDQKQTIYQVLDTVLDPSNVCQIV